MIFTSVSMVTLSNTRIWAPRNQVLDVANPLLSATAVAMWRYQVLVYSALRPSVAQLLVILTL
jgi:hypothetical protein